MTPCRFLSHAWSARLLSAAVAFAFAAAAPAATNNPVPDWGASLATLQIRPSRTDPAIKTFDLPHAVFVNRGIILEAKPGLPAARRQLLLFLPGTVPPSPANPDPANATQSASRSPATAFCQLAANLGYHVVFLRYPNAVSASKCMRDEDLREFERFRMAIIAGGESRHITIPRTESIEHRLIKLLQRLHEARPREEWNRFLTADGAIRWENIAVAGQSQGGGHAALIATKHRVARVIATGAPKDYNVRHGKPAAWFSTDSATPTSRFFCFNHVQDRQAADLSQQLENLRVLGLEALGAPADVDTVPFPFNRSRILLTDFPGGKKLTSREAHGSVMAGRNARHFEPVWRYMLTESVD